MSDYKILPSQGPIQTEGLDATFKKMRKQADRRDIDLVTIAQKPTEAPRTIMKTGNQGGMHQNPYTDYLDPQIRDPLYSSWNFYLPSDRRVWNAWLRYFDRFHPIVGNAIDMHSTVPFSRFQLKDISDPSIRQFYEDMVTEINLFRRILEISREWELIGEAFPFAYWDDEMNAFSDIVVLNPDYVEVIGTYIAGDSKSWRYELIPDETIKQFLMSDNPLDWEIVQQIDPAIIRAVQTDTNAPLDPFNVSHLARKQSPYDDRGTSIVMGCIGDLLYENKLMDAQYSIAGGFVRPRELWKLGIPGEWMPSEGDLEVFRDMLRSAEYDPNFALIGHMGVNVEFLGADRRMLPIIPERQEIEKRLLTRLYTNKAVTHGEGPCLTAFDSTGCKQEVLTEERGFVPWDEVYEGEPIASFNPDTEQVEFHIPTSMIFKDYDGEVVDLTGKDESPKSIKNFFDLSVTANHRMWVQEGDEWKIVPADELREDHRLRCDTGAQTGVPVEYVKIHGYRRHRFNSMYEPKCIEVPIDDYLAFAGYYLSEGSLDFERRHGDKHPSGVSISQVPASSSYQRIHADLNRLPLNVTFHGKDRFRISDRLLAEHVDDMFGHGSGEKAIPHWVKQLPAEKLEILIQAMLAGDGHKFGEKSWEYYTISEQLAKDFQEIAFRAGYATCNTFRDRGGNRRRQYRCRIGNNKENLFTHRPTLSGVIRKRHYKGKVWCFEVHPHELFVIRSAGKIYIVGNTFSNASVAMQFIAARYATKRDFMTEWIKDEIFRPVALANEFFQPLDSYRTSGMGPMIGRSKSEKVLAAANSKELMIPDFQWLSLVDLTDKGQKLQYVMQLVTAGRIPMKTALEMLQIDSSEVEYWMNREEGTRMDLVYQSTRKQMAEARARKQELGGEGGPGGGGDGGGGTLDINNDIRDDAQKEEDQAQKKLETDVTSGDTKLPSEPKMQPATVGGRIFGEEDVAELKKKSIIVGQETLSTAWSIPDSEADTPNEDERF